jgi:glycosyltransferase involved in cell wall biosynthesis
MKKPLVSIVVICYNYGNYLEEAINSALNQTYKNIEIVVIDDGSTDNTAEVVESYVKQKSIRYIYQKNRGIVGARNRAIDEAGGEFYIQLDADDYLNLDYVEKTLKLAQMNNADIVYTDFRQFGEINKKSSFPEYNYEILKNTNFIHASSLVKKSAVGSVRFDEKLKLLSHEDWDFFLRLCSAGKKAIKEQGAFLNYRIHDKGRNNLLKDLEKEKDYVETYSYIINKRIEEGHSKEFDYLAALPLSTLYMNVYGKYKDETSHSSELLQTIDEKQNELDRIVNSRAWRLISVYHRAVSRIKGRLKTP